MTRGQCGRVWWDSHTEHHSLATGERWTDADAERIRDERRSAATSDDRLLAAYDALCAAGGGR